MLGFYDEINHWCALSTDVTLGVEETTDDGTLNLAYAALFQAMRKARKAHSRFLFFVRESSLREAASKVFRSTTTLHRHMQLAILDVKKVNIEFRSLQAPHTPSPEDRHAYFTAHKALLDKQTSILWKFVEDIKSPMAEADAANEVFIEQARKLLFS
jgi:hypothetical protein